VVVRLPVQRRVFPGRSFSKKNPVYFGLAALRSCIHRIRPISVRNGFDVVSADGQLRRARDRRPHVRLLGLLQLRARQRSPRSESHRRRVRRQIQIPHVFGRGEIASTTQCFTTITPVDSETDRLYHISRKRS